MTTSLKKMLFPIISTKIQEKFDIKDGLTNEQIGLWCSKACSVLNLYKQLSVAEFQLKEVLHYVTVEDIINLNVRVKSDEENIKKLFIEKTMPESTNKCSNNLQSPEQTFGEEIKSDPCPKCKSTKTITMAMQRRSADEPVSYYSQCFVCSMRWRTS